MVSSQKEYVDNKYDAHLLDWNSSPRLICYLGFHSLRLWAEISLDTETFKSENIHIWLRLKVRQGKSEKFNREYKLQIPFSHLDWSLPKCEPSSRVWGSVLWLVSGHNAGLWLVNTHHSPARGLRQEEGGRGAHDGAQAEDEEREDGGVASLANVNCVTKYRWCSGVTKSDLVILFGLGNHLTSEYIQHYQISLKESGKLSSRLGIRVSLTRYTTRGEVKMAIPPTISVSATPW